MWREYNVRLDNEGYICKFGFYLLSSGEFFEEVIFIFWVVY